MPEACAKGTFAYTAISSVPMNALRQVATNTLLATALAMAVSPVMT